MIECKTASTHIFGGNISIAAENVQQISGREGFLTLFIVVGRASN